MVVKNRLLFRSEYIQVGFLNYCIACNPFAFCHFSHELNSNRAIRREAQSIHNLSFLFPKPSDPTMRIPLIPNSSPLLPSLIRHNLKSV